MTDNYKYITINSFNKQQSESDTNFTMTINGTFSEDFSQIALVNFICTNSFYNVDDNNNTFDFQEDSGDPVSATITPGNYDLAAIITALQTAMNGVSPNSYTYTITSSAITNMITITSSLGTFSVLITGGLNLMLGFSRYTATGQNNANTAPRIYNLSRYGFFNLICSLSSDSTYNTSTRYRQSIMSYIPICESQNGDIFSFRPQQWSWHNTSTERVNSIQIQLTDEYGNDINLNGGYLSLNLVLR